MSNTTASTPQHVGIILDGNRRWARGQGLPTAEGHRRGAAVFGDMAKYLFDEDVSYVSAFIFSTENWRRTEKEVSFLMGLVIKFTEERLSEFDEAGIRITILGSRDKLKKNVLDTVKRVEQTTQNNKKGTLALCFNYGGQQEIIDATRKLVDSGVSADEITKESFTEALYHPEVPDIDLIIRTSGEQRLSGFMLWRSTYAELLFLDKHWPAVSTEDMASALAEFARRQRRYGA